jgi:hypothetical protein
MDDDSDGDYDFDFSAGDSEDSDGSEDSNEAMQGAESSTELSQVERVGVPKRAAADAGLVGEEGSSSESSGDEGTVSPSTTAADDWGGIRIDTSTDTEQLSIGEAALGWEGFDDEPMFSGAIGARGVAGQKDDDLFQALHEMDESEACSLAGLSSEQKPLWYREPCECKKACYANFLLQHMSMHDEICQCAGPATTQ